MGEHPKPGHVYYSREDRIAWSFIGFWKHPGHRDYHINWTGEYAVIQVSGVLSNPPRVVALADWDNLFELAWEPMQVCKFCGFTRMRPCLTRQPCANLTDYRLEPDDTEDPHHEQ